jgi:hypothetical protein
MNANGDPECGSLQGSYCAYGETTCDRPLPHSVACGAQFLRLHGSTGYDDPTHWCAITKAKRQRMAVDSPLTSPPTILVLPTSTSVPPSKIPQTPVPSNRTDAKTFEPVTTSVVPDSTLAILPPTNTESLPTASPVQDDTTSKRGTFNLASTIVTERLP